MLASVSSLIAACASAPPQHAFDPARLADIDHAIDGVIARRGMPGAQFHLERDGAVDKRAYGVLSYDDPAPVTATTLYDVASLTKVLATAPSVLMLAEEGKLDLEAPLARYLPACGGRGRDGITLRHLLTHSSGFPAGLPARPAWEGRAAALALACGKDVTDPPGTFFRYSDINYILLGIIVEQVSGMPLEQFAASRIFAPLQMTHTGYLAPAAFWAGKHRAHPRFAGRSRGQGLASRAGPRRNIAGRSARSHRAQDGRRGRFGRGVFHGGRRGPLRAHAAGRRPARWGAGAVGRERAPVDDGAVAAGAGPAGHGHGHRFALRPPARDAVPGRQLRPHGLHGLLPVDRSRLAHALPCCCRTGSTPTTRRISCPCTASWAPWRRGPPSANPPAERY